jgi:putative membrane protein
MHASYSSRNRIRADRFPGCNNRKLREIHAMRKLGILLGGALALAACSSTPRPPTAAELANPLIAPGYLAQAASSDMFEIQSGQLAQQMSQNASVQSFAGMLITDHTQSTQMLMSAATAAHVYTPPPTLLPPQQAMLDQLRGAGSGYAFDQAFQQAQIQAHQQALMLHQNYANSGDVGALRTTAGQIVPVIQKHLQMAQSLQLTPPAPPPPPPPPPMPAPAPGHAGERG